MNESFAGVILCRNRVFALCWRCVIVAACAVGLYPMFFGAAFSTHSLCYFTTQSNLLLFALFLVLAAGTGTQLFREGARGAAFRLTPWLQLAVVYFVQITFLVFASMLSGTAFRMGAGIALTNILLHYVAPLMALLDWILFFPHGCVGYRHAALWLAYPAAYVVFAFIRAPLGAPFYGGSRYPYFFMDADVLGWNLLWVAPIFFAGFFLLGCLLILLDRRLGRRRSTPPAP